MKTISPKVNSTMAKPDKKPAFINATPILRKSRTSRDLLSKEPEFLTVFGKDAETIRKEVLRVKERLKNQPRLFEKLGAINRPKLKKS
jgi:hypothetical protein